MAAGEPLPAAQDALSITGHAIEARLYAEDARAGFLPATGVLEHLVFPEGARIDTGVRQGDRISPHYDPMIAKITVHGADRASALRSMARALDGTEVAGTVTNARFLRRLIGHPMFSVGDLDTGIIERDLASLTEDEPVSEEALALAAVTALELGGGALEGFTLWSPLRHRVVLGSVAVDVHSVSEGAEVHLAERKIALERYPDGWRIDGARTGLRALRLKDAVAVFGDGGGVFELPDPLARGQGGPIRGAVEAPMPGKITAVLVAAGDTILAGQRLAVLEAMKMEHAMTAPRDGVVAEVLVRPGDQVEAGAAIVRLEEETDA